MGIESVSDLCRSHLFSLFPRGMISRATQPQVADPTTCPQTPAASSSTDSLWTAPQSHLYPTSPLAPTPPSQRDPTTPASSASDILSAFYTRPPTAPSIPSPLRAAATPQQRAKFFRRVTKHDALEPSLHQNRLNVLGGVLATLCAGYMVLLADFGQPVGSVNCFTDLRRWVWGEQGPPKLF